jgi:hypothetical protein
MAMHPVETYLKDLSEIRRTGGGVAEESYYGALENLLNEVGRKLKPRVRCVARPRSCLWADINRLWLATGFDIACGARAS